MILAFLIAFLVMALRLGLYFAGHPAEGLHFMVVHLLAIATIVFFTGHKALARDASTPFPDLLRTGLRDAALYAFLVSLFIWAYYGAIDTGHFPARIDDMVDRGVRQGESEGALRARIEHLFTPFNYASMTLFSLLAASAVNALLIGLLHHKLLRLLRR